MEVGTRGGARGSANVSARGADDANMRDEVAQRDVSDAESISGDGIREPRRSKSPSDPTLREIEDHALTGHASFRSWCAAYCSGGKNTRCTKLQLWLGRREDSRPFTDVQRCADSHRSPNVSQPSSGPLSLWITPLATPHRDSSNCGLSPGDPSSKVCVAKYLNVTVQFSPWTSAGNSSRFKIVCPDCCDHL